MEYLPDDTRKSGLSYQALGTAPAGPSLMDGYMPNQPTKTGLRVSADDLKVGTVEAYICTDCGYIELYVMDPHSVPFKDIEEFTLVGGKRSDQPYR